MHFTILEYIVECFFQIYGEYAKEFVQGPGDSLYLPHGMGHAILNIRDNVAVTENFLFVDALPGNQEVHSCPL